MNICENCEITHDGVYGSGRFCSVKCSRGFSTKAKREEINQKVSKKLIKEETLILKNCLNCEIEFTSLKRKKVLCCGLSCSAKLKWSNQDYRDTVSEKIKKRCSTLEERVRLKDIGRKGGFGKKGYTNNGVYFESNFERKCFEFLDSKLIEFTPHKPIPNSSKVSDLYLNELDIWVELDGIDREKRKKWLGVNYDYWIDKLNIYKRENLTLKVIKNYDEFIDFIINSGV